MLIKKRTPQAYYRGLNHVDLGEKYTEYIHIDKGRNSALILRVTFFFFRCNVLIGKRNRYSM